MRRALAIALLALGCSGPAAHPEVAVVDVADPAASPAATPTAETAIDEPPQRPPQWKDRAPKDVPEPPRDDQEQRARELFQQGSEAYSQGDYQRACNAFQAAYDLVPLQPLLFNIGSCQLRMGNVREACAIFRKYVKLGDPADPRIQQVSQQTAQRCSGVP